MARNFTATTDTFKGHRERDAAHKKVMRGSAREIGDLPPVKNKKRRAAAERSLRQFCESYFPETFCLGWSKDHLRILDRIENAVLKGGLFAMAMPRGSGKTSIVEAACEWSALYGHRDFIVLIGADEGHAELMLDSIKTELETNDLLAEDFPEVVFPIRSLEGIAHRAGGQLYKAKGEEKAERTHIGWTAKDIVLPTIKGSKASGVVVMVRGITGRLRGMKFKRVDGKTVRPSLVVLDDPQTDESAKSPSQCKYREQVLAGAILGLAGPGKKIAGVMPCTVMRPDDMADRILDRKAHPEWNGERTKLVYAWPTNERLWEKYGEIRGDDLRNSDASLATATHFYRTNRAAMDAGAKVAWEQRKNSDELSAIQHVMNLRFERGDEAFMAEYQNDPIPDDQRNSDDPSAEAIAARCNGMEHRAVPSAAHHLTAFIDVQQPCLMATVCGWEQNFTGYVLDYRCWPDPGRPYFIRRELKRTITTEAKAALAKEPGIQGAIQHALTQLCEYLVTTPWTRDDGTRAFIGKIVIDANWHLSTEVVYNFCRRSPHAAILLPWHGKGIGASSAPMSQWRKQRGDQIGHNWRIPAAKAREVRHVDADVNFWKSFVMERLTIAPGDPGALTLWGKDPKRHQLFSEHCASEYRVPVEGRGRKVDEWKHRPEGMDNDFWDGLVANAVAASILGVSMGVGEDGGGKRVRLKLSDIRKARGKATPPDNTKSDIKAMDNLAEELTEIAARLQNGEKAPLSNPSTSPPPPPGARPQRMKLSELMKLRRGR